MWKLTAVQERILREADAVSLPGDGLRIAGSGEHRAARNLESLKYVRVAVPADGRKARVHVTPEGRIALRRIPAKVEKAPVIHVERPEACPQCDSGDVTSAYRLPPGTWKCQTCGALWRTKGK